MRKVLVLASGGLDSSVVVALYASLGYEVYMLYLPYGNRNEDAEFSKLLSLSKKYGIPTNHIIVHRIDMSYSKSSCTDESGSNPYVEMRNLIMLSYGISIAESKGINLVATGFIQVPSPYPDTSEQFVLDMNTLSLSASGIEVVAPLHHLDKEGVYLLGSKLGIKLTDTFSCNESDKEPCGKCYDCVDVRKIVDKFHLHETDNPFHE